MKNLLLFVMICTLLISCTNSNRIDRVQDLRAPETSDEFIEYLTESFNYLTEQQDICRKDYNLNDYERWWYDQKTGYLDFFNGDTLKLRIRYHAVGTISTRSNTWLWAWANPHTLDNVKNESLKVKAFGKENGFERLTKSKWTADEVDGWEMTSIMANVIGAKGAYRVPVDSLFSYMVFERVELVDELTKE